jgi:predicted outer membrane protein
MILNTDICETSLDFWDTQYYIEQVFLTENAFATPAFLVCYGASLLNSLKGVTMLLRRSCWVASFSLFASASAFAETPKEAIENFIAKGQSVMEELDQEAPSAEAIETSINEMLESAKPVLVAYSEKNAGCKEQLDKIIELYPEIDTMTPKEIKKNIEGGAALPEGGDECYAARDIIAHPAIVRATVRLGMENAKVAKLKKEMEEALEHAEEIGAEL